MMFRGLLCGAALALGGPVVAQQITYSDQGLQSCLSAAGGNPAEQNMCIGGAFDMCSDISPNSGSTAVFAACADRELQFWDGMLNDQYGRLKAEARTLDDEADANLPRDQFSDGLRDMQRAWIGYRDAACLFEAVQWRGGTMTGPAVIACRMEITAKQALTLRNTKLIY